MDAPNKRPYKTLFWSTLRISAFTFGGGFVIIPLLRKRFVEELGWVDESEMMDLTAIAQSSPGPIAVNASILIGYRVAGIPGALITALGTVLPPLVTISIISLFYTAFRDNVIVGRVMDGMLAAIAAVVLDVVLTMGKKIAERKRILPFLIMGISFALVRYLHVNIILIIVFCGFLGALDTWYLTRKGGGKA